MNPKILIAFTLAIFALATEVSGRCCGCGFGRGVDYCDCEPAIVRPVAVKPTKVKCLGKPIGDVCACKNVKVKPVSIPRPKFVWKEKKCEVCDNRPLIPAPDHLHDFSQDTDILDGSLYESTSCGFKPLFPVDAVSLSLVNRMQESYAASLPEEKIQYGFYKIPKELPVYKPVLNVPEEKLHTVERQIVELKTPKQVVCNVGCEDIVIEDEETQPIAYLSYKDLGFVPEEVSSPKFVTSCCERRGRPYKHVPSYGSDSEEQIVYRGRCGSVKRIKSCCN